MNTPQNLGDLLRDAVEEIEPADRLADIRARTAGAQRAAARPWFYAAGGVVLATAAAVGAFALLGNDAAPESGHRDHHLATDPMSTQLVPAYFVGHTPRGPRLYREFHEVPAGDPLQAALDRIQRPAGDPDYATPWGHGSFDSVTLGDDTIDVEVGDWTTEHRADELPVQQVVYTLQGAAGRSDWPVRFLQDGEPLFTADSLPQNDVLSMVSISDPAEGNSYSGSMIARGRANSFESTVGWELRDESGKVVARDSTTASGNGDRLYPWRVEIDLTGLPFGFYTFVALTDDPVNDGVGPDTDTRLITVR